MADDWKVVKNPPHGFALFSPEGAPVANCKDMAEVGTHVWVGNLIRRDIKGNVTYADVEAEPIETPVAIVSARIRYEAARKAVEFAEKKERRRRYDRERRNRAEA